MDGNLYHKFLNKLEQEILQYKKRSRLLSWIRLFFFVFGLVFSFLFFQINITIGISVSIVFIISFSFLIRLHYKKDREITKTKALISIYKNELSDKNLFGCGEKYIDHIHLYSSDLDLFGDFSIFNLINRTVTQEGSDILASWFLKKAEKEEIIKRQIAIKELTNKIEFKERFLKVFLIASNSSESTINIKNWIQNFKPQFLTLKWLKIYSFLSPILILVAGIASFFHMGFILLPIFLVMLNVIILTRYKHTVDVIQQYVGKQDAVFLNSRHL